MRTVAHHKDHAITYSTSAELLIEGARFNDEIHRLPTRNATFMPKGGRYFRAHIEATRQQPGCLLAGFGPHRPGTEPIEASSHQSTLNDLKAQIAADADQ